MNAVIAHRAARRPLRIRTRTRTRTPPRAFSIRYHRNNTNKNHYHCHYYYYHYCNRQNWRCLEQQPFGNLRRSVSHSKSKPKVDSSKSSPLSSLSPQPQTNWWQRLRQRLKGNSGGRDDASLARYPNFQTPGGLLRGADYAGTLTFALTGTITAAESGLDVFGSVVVGIITSVGGGTIRDAVFLNRKPFWTEEPEYIWMGLLMGLATFFVWPEWQRKDQEPNPEASPLARYGTMEGALDTLDAVGLSAFCIIGAQNGIRAGMPLTVSAICGMTTATFGGLVRDVLCGRPVRIVHSTAEVYAPPALAGAMVYLLSKVGGASPSLRIGAAFATCMGSRYWAIQNDIKLHTWDIHKDNLGVTVRKTTTNHRE